MANALVGAMSEELIRNNATTSEATALDKVTKVIVTMESCDCCGRQRLILRRTELWPSAKPPDVLMSLSDRSLSLALCMPTQVSASKTTQLDTAREWDLPGAADVVPQKK